MSTDFVFDSNLVYPLLVKVVDGKDKGLYKRLLSEDDFLITMCSVIFENFTNGDSIKLWRGYYDGFCGDVYESSKHDYTLDEGTPYHQGYLLGEEKRLGLKCT